MKALTRVKIRVHLKALPQYLLVLSVLWLTAWFCNKYIEAFYFAVSFVVLRYKFTDIFHCSTTLKCVLMTNSIVLVFIPITIPLTNSLFGGLISGFAVNFIANLIASSYCRITEKKELEALRNEKSIRNVYALNEQDLRQYCKSYNLDFIDEEIVVQRLVHHLKGKDLYDKIGYSKPQMIRRERRIEKTLGITLK